MKIVNRLKQKGLFYSLIYIFENIITMMLILPAYVIMVLVRPWKLIKIGSLQGSRIGHFVANTELFLCRKDLNWESQKSINIFTVYNVCNEQLLLMWSRLIRIYKIPGIFVDTLKKLPGGKEHIINLNESRDVNGIMEKCNKHLFFTNEETAIGNQRLKEMKIDDKQYICILTRDNEYLRKVYPYKDLKGHDYRNCNIEDYKMCVEELIKRDYYIIRMGLINKNVLEINSSKYIEYADNMFASDFMDIYLSATCRFFISCGSGLDSIAEAFRRPILYVNYVPLEHIVTYDYKAITIFKKYWFKKGKKFLKFKEILDMGAGRFTDSQDYDDHDIEVVDNSSKEICDVCIEMDERLNGTWTTLDEDEELQRRFWSLFQLSDLNKVFKSRIGAQFLRDNLELLE